MKLCLSVSSTWKVDDGLAVVKNASGPKLDKLRKDIIKMFKSHGLSITIEINLAVTDFLDVTFDLLTNKYYPYRKPNNEPLYIDANSNHPPSIVRQLPKMVNRRISEISCNREEFDKCKDTYNNALKKSGHNEKLSYLSDPPKKKQRKRKIIWFNPPFSMNVKTNIGKAFLSLVKKHFPPHHKFSKMFNKNSIKISYCCMKSMGSLIKSHNSRVLNQSNTQQESECNCRKKNDCPLDGKCLTMNTIYEATVHHDTTKKIYYGLAEGSFKTRYNNHTKSLRLRNYEHDTELSCYIWKLKDKDKEFNIDWRIAAKAQPYRCGSRRCELCLTEKVIILTSDPELCMNKRDELVSKCRHQNKYKLKNLKS